MQVKSESERRIKEREKRIALRSYKMGKIMILREQGMSYRKIADELDIKNESTVRTLAKEIPYLENLEKEKCSDKESS